MKKRYHDKKAGIIILSVLIVISVLEVVFRIGCMRQSLLTTTNVGEPLATAIFAVILIAFTLAGKQRICYICYGAWLACFTLDQIFGLPGMLVNVAVNMFNPGIVSIMIRLVAMICIIAIGALIVEYLDDGTICNGAFNTFCIIAVVLLVADISIGVYNIAFNEPAALPAGVELGVFKKQIMLDIFNKAYYVLMIVLFTFFAYDSAKVQLEKANLTK